MPVQSRPNAKGAERSPGPLGWLREYRHAIAILGVLAALTYGAVAWLTPEQGADEAPPAPAFAEATVAPPDRPAGEPGAEPAALEAETAPLPETEPEIEPEPDCSDPPVEAFHDLPSVRVPYALLAVDETTTPSVAYIQPARGNEVEALVAGDILPDSRVLAWAGAAGIITCHAGDWQRVDHPRPNHDSLTGEWRVRAHGDRGRTVDWVVLEITETPDGKFTIPDQDYNWGITGQRTGTRLEVDTSRTFGEPVTYRLALRGEASEDLTRLHLSGWVTVTHHVPNPDSDERSGAITLHAERLAPLKAVQAKYRDSIRERTADALGTLRSGLSAYIEQYGRLPASVDELLAMFADESPAVRRAIADYLVRYKPHAFPLPPARTLPSPPIGDPRAAQRYETEMVRRHRAEAPMPVTALEFRITETGDRAGVSVSPFGGLTTWHQPHQAPRTNEEWSVIRAQSANQLKQLGLVIKMFANEYQDHTPPGWWSVYPEYLMDLTVLTHPLDEPGTVSYQYLAPSTNTRRVMEQTYDAQHLENPAALSMFESEYPVVVERQPYGEPPGRNVLFADGHVEWMSERDYQQRAREWFR